MYLVDHKACVFSSLIISSPTWRNDNKYFVRVFCCPAVFSLSFLSGHWHTWKMKTSASWRSLERFSTPVPQKGPAFTNLEICLVEDFYHFLFSSHLHEFTVTLVDKFPLSSKLRTGKSTTASVSDRTRRFQSSLVISDLRFFLAWMLGFWDRQICL